MKKNSSVLIFLSVLLCVLIQCTRQSVCDETSNAPSWRNIIPGLTAQDGVNTILGMPYDEGTSAYNPDHYIAAYADEESGQSFPHRIFFDNQGCTLLISESRFEPSPNLSNLVQQYGEPEAVKLGGASLRAAITFIYAEQGIAIVGQFAVEPENAYLMRVMYFVPTTIDSFLEEWSAELFLEDDIAPHPDWENYYSE